MITFNSILIYKFILNYPTSSPNSPPSTYTYFIQARRIISTRVFERDTEIELEEHDVNDICASSYDPRFPPTAKMLNPHNNKIAWLSTGLIPQVGYKKNTIITYIFIFLKCHLFFFEIFRFYALI